jgi:hypothetical protein
MQARPGVTVVVTEACADRCCADVSDNRRRRHRIYPSGWAVALDTTCDDVSSAQGNCDRLWRGIGGVGRADGVA